MVGSENGCTSFRGDFAVPTSATACVENSFAGKFAECKSGLRFEGRSVFVVVSNFVAIPLKTEAGEMFLLNEPRNPIDDRMSR